MTLDAIVTLTLAKLDELTPQNGALVISTNNDLLNPYKRYINEFLPDCCDRTLKAAPYHTLPLTTIPDTSIKDNTDGVLLIELPDTFLRIGLVDFKSWERPVMSTITIDNPNYSLQKNKYTRGGNAKPIVILKQAAGKKYLECYSVNAGEEGQPHEATCVIKTTPEGMPDVLIPALTWLVGSEVLKAIEKSKEAELFFTSFTSSLINL